MLKRFSQISATDVATCGGKGASLGEMTQAGFLVPQGFVLTTSAFGTNVHQWDDEVLHAFDQLNCKFVAVRSSGTKEDGSEDSFAGQFNTYLFVSKEKLIEQILECHASVKSDRILAYCKSKNINPDDIKVAVVVQKMVNSESAGVCFTANPVSGVRDEVMIEAGFGLGEAVVSGMITPDNYVVKKCRDKDLPCPIVKQISNQIKKIVLDIEKGGTREEAIEETVASAQKLSDEHILQLAESAIKIEEHYGKPMDIERAVEDGELFILQARPITTLEQQREIFEKAYTRDTTLIIQQAGNDGYLTGLLDMDTKTPPYEIPVIHYMHNGTIEIWKNETYLAYYLDKLLEQNKQGSELYDKSTEEYLNVLHICEQKWKTGYTTDIIALKDHIQMIFEVMKGFNAFYYAGLDERTPIAIRERALGLRGTDTFFSSNDTYIRTSLMYIYPEIKGYENCILRQEIKNPPSLEVLKQRSKSFVVQGTKRSALTTIDEYILQHPEYHFHREAVAYGGNVLQGQTGYSGIIRGKVFVLFRNEQVHQVPEGAIIVAPMTTPEHVPAMEKCAGIITDEGGITCHAAIVARELKKPCIIGTKIATQVLKDGDLVEVDADNGIVRILEQVESIIIGRDSALVLIQKFIADKGGEKIRLIEGNISSFVLGIPASMPYSSLLNEYHKHSLGTYLLILGKGKGSALVSEDTYKAATIATLETYLQNKDLKESKDFNVIQQKIEKYYFTYSPTHLKNLTNEALENCIIQTFELLRTLWLMTIFSELLDEEIIHKYFYKFQGTTDFAEFLEISQLVDFETLIFERNTSLLQFDGTNLYDIQWICGNYSHTPSLEDCEKLIRENIETLGGVERIKKDVEKAKKELYTNTSRIESFRKTLSGGRKDLFDFIQTAIFIRDTRKKYQYQGITLLSNAVREMLGRYAINPKLLVYTILYKDFMLGAYKEIGFREELERRNKGFLIYVSEQGMELEYSDYEEAKQITFEKLFDEHIANEIRGNVGYKGNIQGKVRIILHSEDFDKFQDGEILVTSMTRPEFVPLMKKATAIITNEGGITCHAAIISRELKKPCIIGTKIATQVLKDGDLVEVDADNGIVRILKE